MQAWAADPERTINRYILLTDIAGSSRLAEAYPDEYYAALEQHNSIVETAVATHGGEIFKNLGDGYLALFNDADGALGAAVELQLALGAGSAGSIAVFADGSKISVRSIVHGGQLTRLPGHARDWFGPPLNRAARICGVCHPGQLLISGVVRANLAALHKELTLLDLGNVRLRDLGQPEQLYQLTHPQFTQRQFPPLLGLDSRPNNLAVQPNAFIGRAKELAELSRLLAGDTRLLTLHAPGGYGKSRLASQLCAHVLWRFAHGAYEVRLDHVRGHQHMPQAIADATGFRFFGSREPSQQVLDYLRNKEMLLCFGNFEHMLKGTAFIAELLRTAPKVRIVATSREPLRLSAERVYLLEPLPLGPGSDSFQLFVERASRIKYRFTLSDESALWVERICERLEGIPLAIELFAAWADSFTLPEMYAELGRQLELTARLADVPVRQRSVRASCDWSYSLLKPELQRALRRLAVFQGGFFLEAAQDVLGQRGMSLRNALAALSDKSWLFTRETTWKAPGATTLLTRYQLRDTASREYALLLLKAQDNSEEWAQAAAAHAAHYAALLAREGPRLEGAGESDNGKAQLAALQHFRIEQSNILGALDTALSQAAPAWLLPLAQYLHRYLEISSAFYSQRERYTALLQAAQELHDPRLELWALLGLARAQLRLSGYGEAQALYERALALARELDDGLGESQCLNNMGVTAYMHGDYAAARTLHEQALALARKLEHSHAEAGCLGNLGNVATLQGEYQTARELYGQALACYRQLGDPSGEEVSLYSLGVVERSQGNYAAALKLYEQALALARDLGDRSGEAHSLSGLGNVLNFLGDYSAAYALLQQVLALMRELGDRNGETNSLYNLGGVEYARGNYDAARALYEEALQLMRELQDTRGQAHALRSLARVQHIQRNYSAARELYRQALALQRDIGERSGEANSCRDLANVEYCEKNYISALELYLKALKVLRELEDKPGIAVCCACAGAALAALGRVHDAIRALHGARHCVDVLGYHLEPDDQLVFESGTAWLADGITAQQISAGELAQLKTQAEALSFDELADFVLGALQLPSAADAAG